MSQAQVREIKAKINTLFSNTSVPVHRTRRWMEEIKLEVDNLIDVLPPKDEQDEEEDEDTCG